MQACYLCDGNRSVRRKVNSTAVDERERQRTGRLLTVVSRAAERVDGGGGRSLLDKAERQDVLDIYVLLVFDKFCSGSEDIKLPRLGQDLGHKFITDDIKNVWSYVFDSWTECVIRWFKKFHS